VLAATVGTSEQVILPAERDRPDGALDDVAVELDAAVVEEAAEALPARQRVANGVGELGFARHRGELPFEPGAERLEERLAAQLAHAATLLGRLPADLGFDGIETGDAGECLAGDRCRCVASLQLVELAPDVRPAEGQLDRASRRQFAVGAVAVDLQDAAEPARCWPGRTCLRSGA
jgi:hypothetical protein